MRQKSTEQQVPNNSYLNDVRNGVFNKYKSNIEFFRSHENFLSIFLFIPYGNAGFVREKKKYLREEEEGEKTLLFSEKLVGDRPPKWVKGYRLTNRSTSIEAYPLLYE